MAFPILVPCCENKRFLLYFKKESPAHPDPMAGLLDCDDAVVNGFLNECAVLLLNKQFLF